jgi:pimeloyl-ACP methyl ester carboxylesterase
MEHKSQSSERGTVHDWTGGRGDEWIVYIHVATMDHGLFREQAEDVAAHHKFIAWGVPAHGQSRPYTRLTVRPSTNSTKWASSLS